MFTYFCSEKHNVSSQLFNKSIVVMDEKIEKIVLELKSVLVENYGENLNKFYIVQFNDVVGTKWEGLISLKSGEEHEKQNIMLSKVIRLLVNP